MFMLEQVIVELLNLVISVYHLTTVSLDRTSVLFLACHLLGVIQFIPFIPVC
jgi:hypothetical protein